MTICAFWTAIAQPYCRQLYPQRVSYKSVKRAGHPHRGTIHHRLAKLNRIKVRDGGMQ